MNRLPPLLFLLSIAIFSCGPEENGEAIRSPFESVNPFIGTGGHGHTYPGATTPFGMVQLSPDTRLEGWDGCGGYHADDSVIYGFTHTHLQGTGITDYGDVLLMPTRGQLRDANSWRDRYSSAFSKDSEVAEPGYYRVFLDDHEVEVELTTTPRVGIHRYTFAESDSCTVFLDLAHRDSLLEYSLYPLNDSILLGHRVSKEWAEQQHLYFAIAFNRPFEYQDQTYEVSRTTNPETGGTEETWDYVPVFPLPVDEGKELIIKVGISAVDAEGALNNLQTEAPHWDFDQYRADARKVWEEALGKISIEGGKPEERSIFYTSLYHSLTVPNLYSDADGRYRGTDLRIHEIDGAPQYTVFSLWDTYRAAHPLYTLIEPQKDLEFIQSFLRMYEQGGQLPMWELAANYTGCMIGYHSVPVITDAYVKGIDDFDHQLALQAMIQAADSNHLGKKEFAELGYIPANVEHESVSKTLEYAYDDWCIAEFARALGDTVTANRFYERAHHYQNLFDPKTNFFRPRREGGWIPNFDPREVNFNYTEANGWQYNFYVPQDIEGHIELVGGDEAYSKLLDSLFYGNNELTGRGQPDITGLIGQYAHGNEPSHHMAYLYAYTGHHWKTQELVQRICEEQYSNAPDGLSGNEDCGQMSAWYVFSALGFYPVTPGAAQYVIGAPLFDRVMINLENGNTFELRASNRSESNRYIQNVSLNGEDYPLTYLEHGDILKGGILQVEYGPTPNKEYGQLPGHRPPSCIDGPHKCATPIIQAPRTFKESQEVEFLVNETDAVLMYKLQGDPEWRIYSEPLKIDETTLIYAKAIHPEFGESPEVHSEIKKIDHNWQLELNSEFDNQYHAGGINALIDGITGDTNFKTGEWQGYWGKDLEVTIDLQGTEKITNVSLGVLQDSRPWIIYPAELIVYTSLDGETFTQVGRTTHSIDPMDEEPQRMKMEVSGNASARYVRVEAVNYGGLPATHISSGQPAWLFVDEIEIATVK